MQWARARRDLLAALAKAESYTKEAKGGGKDVVQPLPQSLTALWADLSTAEWSLFNSVKDRIREET